MKRATRVAIIVTILILQLYLSSLYLSSISRFGYRILGVGDKSSVGYQKYVAPAWVNLGDKGVVMAKMEEENTEWVSKYLPDWQPFIYTVNNPSAHLTTPLNKGHEALAYLTHIITHYTNLTTTTAFIHAHESGFWNAWHTDAPGHSNVISLSSLNLSFVQEKGYVNLRCDWNPGCLKEHRRNRHVTEEIWGYMFGNDSSSQSQTSLDPGTSKETTSKGLWQSESPIPFPPEIAAPCCAQFAVSASQILLRPKSDYERYRQWIIDTPLNDAKSGRVLEFLWHVIFGMDAVFCPDVGGCYCEVYGRC